MEINDYKVTICLDGSDQPEVNSGIGTYVPLANNTKYEIYLKSYSNARCNVTVTVDGKKQGTWRLGAKGGALLERPANDKGCFTFYALEGKQAAAAELDTIDPTKLGLVKVVFTPEREPRPQVLYKGMGSTRGGIKGLSYSAGGTGLSGNSNQEFGIAERMDLDHSKSVTLYLRLIAKKEQEDSPRPLTDVRSSLIPPPVG